MIWTKIMAADRATRRKITERSEKFCVRYNINPEGLGPELAIQHHCEQLRSSGLPWAISDGEYVWELWLDLVKRCLKERKQ